MEQGRCTACRRKPRVHRRGSLTTSGPGGHRLPRAPGGRPGPPPPAGRGQVTPAVCCASPRSQREAQSPGQGGAGCWRGRRLPPTISLWCFRTREPVPGASGMEEPAEVRGRGGACGGCTPRPGRRHTGAPTRPQTPILAGGTRPAGVAAPLGTGVTPGNVSPDWFHPGTSCPEQTLPSPGRGRAARRVRPERRGRGQEEPGLGPEPGPGERKEEGRGDLAGASVPGHSAPCGVGPSVLPALGTSVDASCWSGRAHGLEASGGPHGRVLFGVLTDGSLNPDSQPPGQRQTSKHGAGPWGGTDMPSPGEASAVLRWVTQNVPRNAWAVPLACGRPALPEAPPWGPDAFLGWFSGAPALGVLSGWALCAPQMIQPCGDSGQPVWPALSWGPSWAEAGTSQVPLTIE